MIPAIGTHPLAERLMKIGYEALLGPHADARLIESFTTIPDIARDLVEVVGDPTVPCRARFIAAELLFRHVDMVLGGQNGRTGLGRCYFEAMRHNETGNGADWAFGDGPNELAPLGRTVVDGGHADAFADGLDDDHPLTMTFSWGVPPHFAPPYRVKDVAALIIARGRAMSLDLAGTPRERDLAITDLQQRLRAST